MIKNFLATWYCESILNYTLHVYLLLCLNTENMIIRQIFRVGDTVVD